MREWAGVDPATGAGLWSLYYDDLNGNGIFDNADAPISSMTTVHGSKPRSCKCSKNNY
jgi:hypothetical protein